MGWVKFNLLIRVSVFGLVTWASSARTSEIVPSECLSQGMDQALAWDKFKTSPIKNFILRNKRPFDSEVFNREVLRLKRANQTHTLNQQKIDSFESAMALIELTAPESQGLPFEFDSSLLEKGQARTAVYKKIKKLLVVPVSDSEKLTQPSIEQVLSDLYEIRYSRQFQMSNLMTANRQTWVQRRIASRVALALHKENLVSAMSDLGLLGEGRLRQKIIDQIQGNPEILDLALTAATDGLSTYLGGSPVKLPEYKPLHRIELTPEQKAKVMIEGFDSIYSELLKKYGAKAEFERVYAITKYLFGRFMLASALVTSHNLAQKQIDETQKRKSEEFANQTTKGLDQKIQKAKERDQKIDDLSKRLDELQKKYGHSKPK